MFRLRSCRIADVLGGWLVACLLAALLCPVACHAVFGRPPAGLALCSAPR